MPLKQAAECHFIILAYNMAYDEEIVRCKYAALCVRSAIMCLLTLHLPTWRMPLHRRILLSLFTLPLFAGLVKAGPAAPAALDAAVTQHLGADYNGVVLLQAGPAAAPQIGSYGLANREQKLPFTASTPFQIASISKWLSAVAVLRLVDQRKLKLDLPISTYLPKLPAHTGAITLRQLMSNSAGIPNGAMQEYKKNPGMADEPLSKAAATERYATGPLLFAPGTAWDYSPTTWIVVAAIIERASGMPFEEAINDLVLRPAKATSTAVPLTPFKDKPGAAQAYKAAPSTELNMPPHMVFVAASGTIYSTVSDLAAIAHTVYETALLTPSSRAELSRVMVPSENYALGGRVRKMMLGGRERTVAWETGAMGGYKSVLAYVPGEGKTVVIANNTSMDQKVLASAAEALLKGLY